MQLISPQKRLALTGITRGLPASESALRPVRSTKKRKIQRLDALRRANPVCDGVSAPVFHCSRRPL